MCESLKALLRVVGPIWEIVVALINTQTYAVRTLGSIIFVIEVYDRLHSPARRMEGHQIDRYLKAEMSEGAIGIRLNISSALRSTVCECLGP